ncbi:MAG: hypothetical protein WAN57_12520 [Smithella sp.]
MLVPPCNTGFPPEFTLAKAGVPKGHQATEMTAQGLPRRPKDS